MLDRLSEISRPFMDMITAESRSAIEASAIKMRYADGALIHNRGDEKPGLSIVRQGIVRVGLIRTEGTFVITSIFGPGQSFGEFTLFAGLPRTHDIIAQGETEVWQLPGERFLRLRETRPDLMEALIKTALVRSHVLLEMIEAMRSLPVLERVAKVLVILMTTAGQTSQFYTRQSDLAVTLGLSRTSLSKALGRLEADGLVTRGYGQIRLPDRDRLITWITARDP
ncbi:Crp/Fnr family transcriptional regulator [Litorimonas cladophorae]|uniref:Crp/Fnr family transcriptional regulator n=1 Tax=Litorimonas cladophorae TaxID=1220491 RepID=A0A918KJG3_9PROT|nr:Crp/Fnr family transcriptional regulator [Litorimonas cladophorae]GGX65728.1 Crp/Fnr family transcriptional regulator [Litorimonas cladophorae]